MAQHLVVPAFDVAEACDANLRRSRRSASSVEKKLSGITLSSASPTEPIDVRAPASPDRLPQATGVYCLSWSLSWVTSLGRRWPTSVSSAPSTRSARKSVTIAQSTILRLIALYTLVKYKIPTTVSTTVGI